MFHHPASSTREYTKSLINGIDSSILVNDRKHIFDNIYYYQHVHILRFALQTTISELMQDWTTSAVWIWTIIDTIGYGIDILEYWLEWDIRASAFFNLRRCLPSPLRSKIHMIISGYFSTTHHTSMLTHFHYVLVCGMGTETE